MLKLVSAALCAAILVAAAGCGSSNDSSSASKAATTAAATTPLPTPKSTTTTKSDPKALLAAHKAFLKRVNPICEDYNRTAQSVQKELRAAEKQAGRAVGNVDTYAAPLKRATAAAQLASKRFAEAKPPAAEVQTAALIGRALKAQAKGNELLLQAARSDDPQAFGVATAGAAAGDPAAPVADARLRDDRLRRRGLGVELSRRHDAARRAVRRSPRAPARARPRGRRAGRHR